MKNRICYLATLLALLSFLTAGCGINNNRTGRLLVYTDWPAATRSLPSYAQSARITLEPGDGSRGITQIVNRQSDGAHETVTAFERVPRLRGGDNEFYYQHLVRVQLYTGQSASGALLGDAEYFFQYRDFHFNHDLRVADYYRSELRRMVVNAPSEVFLSNGSRQLGGYAENYNGALVPLPDSAMRFSLVAGSEYANLTPDGILTPVATGTVQVRLEEVDGTVASSTMSIQIAP